MDDVDSPGGYEPYRRYPIGGAAVDFVALAIAVALWTLLEVDSLVGALSLAHGVVVILTVLPVLMAHEIVHYATGRLLGLTPTIHWGFPTPHAAPLRQHVRRGQNVAVLLAPTVLISGGALAATLVVSHPLALAVCTFVALVNTACAAGDLVGATWLAWQPPGTLVYLDAAQDRARELYARPK
ncbi:DUF3267 domain-containing protein [Halomarina salina]|uniref:DUF3267 domain-containing protein n=1 Tax=Halomarina salina TaxID=1872699 RepID=A0ABD5RHK7_9EURY|nr:DUF3267 domain-containing protein [Halomarina salina]